MPTHSSFELFDRFGCTDHECIVADLRARVPRGYRDSIVRNEGEHQTVFGKVGIREAPLREDGSGPDPRASNLEGPAREIFDFQRVVSQYVIQHARRSQQLCRQQEIRLEGALVGAAIQGDVFRGGDTHDGAGRTHALGEE